MAVFASRAFATNSGAAAVVEQPATKIGVQRMENAFVLVGISQGQPSPNSEWERPPCWVSLTGDMSYALRNWTKSRSLPLSSKLLWSNVEPDPHFVLEAATSGLLLMAHNSQILGRRSFLVNPLNRSRREIPLLPMLKDPSCCHLLGMVEDKKSRSHKIIVVHSELVNCPGAPAQEEIYVYDSNTNRWDLAHCMRRQYNDYRGLRNAVFMNRELYILGVMQLDECWIYRFFLVLPTRWVEVAAKHSFKKLSNVQMFEYGGSLMLVAMPKVRHKHVSSLNSNSNSNSKVMRVRCAMRVSPRHSI